MAAGPAAPPPPHLPCTTPPFPPRPASPGASNSVPVLLGILRLLGREVLRQKIRLGPRNAVLVGSPIDPRVAAAEVIRRRRRTGNPFKSRRVPGIRRGRRAAPQTLKEIVEENG